MKLCGDCSKSLHDYGKENFCLTYGPGNPAMVLYLFSATTNVLDILVTKDLVLLIHLSAIHSIWISCETLHVSCLQHVLGHADFKQMDRATFQAGVEDTIQDNPAAPDKTAFDKHIEELASTIVEFTSASIHKCVCQDEVCLNWLASVRMATQIQVSSVTAMKNLLL
jgi:hypothetical protein